jgi:predicted transcriptional regulator
MTDTSPSTTALTAQIVAAYVSRNEVPRGEIGKLVAEVHQALLALAQPVATPSAATTKRVIKKTVFPDYLICLEDGLRFKSLKRHLRVKYNLTPEQYRAKHGLSADYPMVAPRYAQTRSTLAKSMGLGQAAKAKR